MKVAVRLVDGGAVVAGEVEDVVGSEGAGEEVSVDLGGVGDEENVSGGFGAGERERTFEESIDQVEGTGVDGAGRGEKLGAVVFLNGAESLGLEERTEAGGSGIDLGVERVGGAGGGDGDEVRDERA